MTAGIFQDFNDGVLGQSIGEAHEFEIADCQV
jgi:hypothetical protein